jgi:hypothetical protein
MYPLNVNDETKPKAHKTNKTIAIVKSIATSVWSCDTNIAAFEMTDLYAELPAVLEFKSVFCGWFIK